MKYILLTWILICFSFFNINAQTAEDYLKQGQISYNQKDYQTALSNYNKAIKLDSFKYSPSLDNYFSKIS